MVSGILRSFRAHDLFDEICDLFFFSRASESQIPRDLRVTLVRDEIAVFGEYRELGGHLRVVGDHVRQQYRVGAAVRDMVFTPSLCAREWLMPRNAFVNAMPAMHDALCIFSRATASSGSYVRAAQILEHELYRLYRKAVRIVGSEYRHIRLYRVSQHVIAGIRRDGLGIVRTNCGSMIATSGVSS
jgi:hypothetical protein